LNFGEKEMNVNLKNIDGKLLKTIMFLKLRERVLEIEPAQLCSLINSPDFLKNFKKNNIMIISKRNEESGMIILSNEKEIRGFYVD
jgi:hypothetical protein